MSSHLPLSPRPAPPSGRRRARRCGRAARLVACIAILTGAAGAGPAAAQCTHPGRPPSHGAALREGLHEVDLGGLDATARERVLAILNAAPCLCGCPHTLASCRARDAECARSRSLSSEVVRRVREGQGDDEVRAYLRSQPVMPRPHTAGAAPPGAAAGRPRRAGPPAGPALDPRVYEIPTDGAPSRGPQGAPVTIVEFADFQCPFCARSLPLLEEVLSLNPHDVRLVFKHFPLPSHARARDAAMAALAAQEQGRFWPMHDLLFAGRSGLEREGLRRMAAQLGLDLPRFERDLDSAALAGRLERDLADGRSADLTGTPMFYVNGRKLRVISREGFQRALEESLAGGAR